MTDKPDDLDREWHRYRYKQRFGLAAITSLAGVILSILGVVLGDGLAMFIAVLLFGLAVVSAALGIHKYRCGPQPDEAPVQEIDLTDEQVEHIASQISGRLREEQDDA